MGCKLLEVMAQLRHMVFTVDSGKANVENEQNVVILIELRQLNEFTFMVWQ